MRRTRCSASRRAAKVEAVRGDFTRLIFRKIVKYVSVLLQQGRVTLDADSDDAATKKGRRTRRKSRQP